MNLLSPIDQAGWSLILPDLPKASGDYEGFNYLGLGVLLLVPLALIGGYRSGISLKALLSRYRAIQQAQGYEGAYLFPNRRGQPLSETQASAVFPAQPFPSFELGRSLVSTLTAPFLQIPPSLRSRSGHAPW